jgi:DNA polymerase-3 subunit delta'
MAGEIIVMSGIRWNKLIGQERIKNVFDSAVESNTLGHAYLLCGDAGSGKFAAAVDLAQALLCTSDQNKPCGECVSCKKVTRYSHSDFHVIMPVSLDKEHKSSDGKLSEAGWQLLSGTVLKRIEDPYALRTFSSIPSIPVEWVKEVTHAINRGPLEGSRNVVIMDSVDLMATEAANAMLKTLEEPPAGTMMILCTNRIHAVLPTIISRCQILRFGWLPPETIRTTLAEKFNISPKDPKVTSCIGYGSLGEAMQQFQSPGSVLMEDTVKFWTSCVAQDWAVITGIIDTFSQFNDYGSYEKIFLLIMQGIRSSFFRTLDGAENYIMGDGTPEFPVQGIRTPERAGELIDLCERSIGYLRARANISLVFADFAISVMEIFHGKKCQIG